MKLKMRSESPEGPILGQGTLATPIKGTQGGMFELEISKPVQSKLEKAYLTYDPNDDEKLGANENIAFINMTFSN